MKKFIICTENTCDLDSAYLYERNVGVVKLHYFLNGEEVSDDVIPLFYKKLKDGCKGTTSQPSPAEFEDLWTPYLKEDFDILHLSFSSVLSGTYSNACATANRLKDTFPDNKIIVVDTKSQSGGQGLLVDLVCDYKEKGHPIDECYEYAINTAPKINHIFTLDNLRSLASSGRVSNVEAFIGNLLQIKPLLYTDPEGNLKPFSRVISKKLALNGLVEKTKSRYTGEVPLIYISHADCLSDAEIIGAKLASLGATIKYLPLSPVIGSHTGINTISVFFVGTDRNMR